MLNQHFMLSFFTWIIKDLKPFRVFLASLHQEFTPKNVEEGLSQTHWKKAIDEENRSTREE